MTKPPSLVIEPAVVLVTPAYHWLPAGFWAAFAAGRDEAARCLLDEPRQPRRCFWKGVRVFFSTWFRPTFGSFITWMIATLDKGLYTHAGLTVDGCFIDARARVPVGGKKPKTVLTTELAHSDRQSRVGCLRLPRCR